MRVITNAPYPNRIQLVLDSYTGPFNQTGPYGSFDPRRDLEVYVDGVLVPVRSFIFDSVNNRYLLYMSRNINLQGVIQVVHHMPNPPFAGVGSAYVPSFALIGSYDTQGDAPVGISISPTNQVIPVGSTEQYTAYLTYPYTAYLTYPDGSMVAQYSGVTWQSSDTMNATIDGAGLATGVTAGGGGSSISATYGSLSAFTHLGVSGMETRAPLNALTSGGGAAWMYPPEVAGQGFGTNAVVSIYEFSISNNVVTFLTGPQNPPLVAGQTVTVNLLVGSYLNGQLTVLPDNLSTTQFSASFTHADVASTYDAGSASSQTSYAYAFNGAKLTLSPGQYAAYNRPDPGTPVVESGGSFFGIPHVYIAYVPAGVEVNGTPLYGVTAISDSGHCSIPELPNDAIIQTIKIIVQGTQYGDGNEFYAYWDDSYTAPHATSPASFSLYNYVLDTVDLQTTNLSVIPTIYFENRESNSLQTGTPYVHWTDVPTFEVAVIYTLPNGSSSVPTPDDQLQNLFSQQFNFAIESPSTVLGVQVQFSSGISVGSGPVDLTVQLTLAGVPVGDAKSVTVGDWSSAYTLGGSTDLWGLTSLTDAQVNDQPGSPPTLGLGVVITGTLPVASQVNVNSMETTVWYY